MHIPLFLGSEPPICQDCYTSSMTGLAFLRGTYPKRLIAGSPLNTEEMRQSITRDVPQTSTARASPKAAVTTVHVAFVKRVFISLALLGSRNSTTDRSHFIAIGIAYVRGIKVR
jgi:hypothetical protein